MATQKPGEWANSLLARFEEQVNHLIQVLKKNFIKKKNGRRKKKSINFFFFCVSELNS